MLVWLSKLIALVAMLVVTVIAGLLPIKLINVLNSSESHTRGVSRKEWTEHVLSYLNCFSGGVFLAVTLLHLLPDVRHDFASVFASLHDRTEFPLAEFVTCLGFFIVMLIENVVLEYQRGNTRVTPVDGRSKETTSCAIGVDCPENRPICDKTASFGSSSSGTDSGACADSDPTTRASSYGSLEHAPCRHTPGGDRQSCSRNENNDMLKTDYDREHQHRSTAHNLYEISVESEDSDVELNNDKTFERKAMLKSHTDSTHAGHSHGLFDADNQLHSIRSFVLLIALSTHTIFEGLALGLQETSEQVWTLFTAVIIHKIIMAFTAGLRFYEGLRDARKTALYVFIFAITAPLGVAIGLAVSMAGRNGFASDVTSSALQGIATGTFLYVTFFEVLFEEMSSNQNVGKVLAVVIGFSCITVLTFLTGEGHTSVAPPRGVNALTEPHGTINN